MTKFFSKLFVMCVVLLPLPAYALNMTDAMENDGMMTTIRGSMIALCLAIAFITIAVKASLEGEAIRINHLVFRLIFVVIALMAAGRIQGFVWGMGESIADHFLPGPSLGEMHQTLEDRVIQMQAENGSFNDINPITNTTGFFNFVAFQVLLFLESAALTLYFFVFGWFKAMHHVVMMFLGAMAPFMICATIIPGVKGFTNWLKLVVSVALWPVVASFFLKSHLVSAISSLGGSEDIVFTSDTSSFYLNIDSLQMFSESCLFGIFLLATPLIASAIVSGSANAFAAGSVFLMGAGPLSMMRKSTRLFRGAGKGAVLGARLAYDGATLAKNPMQAPRMIGNAVKSNLSSSAKFRPAMPKMPKGGRS